jgi:hypothetical protein
MFCIKNICREGNVVIASCRNVVELRYILGSTESVKWSISFWAFPQSIEIAFQEPVERKKYVASKNTDSCNMYNQELQKIDGASGNHLSTTGSSVGIRPTARHARRYGTPSSTPSSRSAWWRRRHGSTRWMRQSAACRRLVCASSMVGGGGGDR